MARVSEAGLAGDEPLYRLLHQTIDAVGSQYGELRYNVAIARLTGQPRHHPARGDRGPPPATPSNRWC